MELYKGLKEIANTLQKSADIGIYSQLIELSSQALDMQSEILRLTEENSKLKRSKNIEDKIVRCEVTYITLCDDEAKIKYCSCCWDVNNKLVQVNVKNSAQYECPNCNNNGIYNKVKHDEANRIILGVNRNNNRNRY